MESSLQTTETLSAYIPMEQRQALIRRVQLPERTRGAALFADISGFTPLTAALVRELGPQRGAEELTRNLNLVYDALIADLHHYGGSVISFSGDAITCWIDGDDGLRATACALAMQQTMDRFAAVTIPSGATISLAMKAAVAAGMARRFTVGDDQIHVVYTMAGSIFERLAAAESLAQKGEVILDQGIVTRLGDQVRLIEQRQHAGTGANLGVAGGLAIKVAPAPWPHIPQDTIHEAVARPWLLPPVYERLRAGKGEFLAELRPAAALFLRFSGIDYEGDEAAGAKLDAYIRWVQSILARYEGFLLQLTIGDKGSYFFASFGAPIAHEDDAMRAISAALELQSPPDHLSFIDSIQIGISQGQMRTGAYGGSSRRTYGVLGDETNVAARLMQAAAPGQIVVSSQVQQASLHAFTWEAIPPIKLKGKTGLFETFSPRKFMSDRPVLAQAFEYEIPMIGRQKERALLALKLDQAQRGRGQIVAIKAEAGMGKTRLVVETIRLAREKDFTVYEGECQSYGGNISYLVWQSIWRSFFGLDSSQDLSAQLATLEEKLAQIDPALQPRQPLLGAVLNIPIPDNELTHSFDAKLRKTSLEALLVDCLRARAEQQPILLVLEDCHWLDSLSHDLLEVIGRAIADLPVVLLMAYRDMQLERLQATRVSQLPSFTEILLDTFTSQETEQLISLKLPRLFGERVEILPSLVQRLASRSQGNPFYLEEFLNYIHARGIKPTDSEALATLELPSSLQSLILSRIDQLSESQKITLKVASVIGRLFRAALLWGTYPTLGEPERVKADLETLLRMDLVIQEASEPELAYLFKHIVTQEVAYESLPYAIRAVLHDQLAQFIEQRFQAVLSQYVDLLAYHYGRSENSAKKREYLRKAGEAAQADYANEPAIDYYRRLLPLLAAEERVTIMLKLGEVLHLVGNWDEASNLYQQALALAQQSNDGQAAAWCQVAMAELLRRQGQFDEAATWLDKARRGFMALGDQAGVAQALHYGGTMAAQQGNYQQATSLYEQSLAQRRQLNDKPHIASLLSNLGILARYQGDPVSAARLYEESLAIRRQLKDKWAISVSLNNLGNLALDQGDYMAARQRLEEALSLQREVGDKSAIAVSLNTLANIMRAQGDFSAARRMYRESLAISRSLGDKWNIAHLLEDVGGLAAMQAQAEAALWLAGAASALREAIGARLSPTEQERRERMLIPARELLGDAAASATLAGQKMSWEQAVEYAINQLLA